MKDEFDINVCYRKVFEILSADCSIQKVVNNVADYTGASIVAVDIGGNILASTDHHSHSDMIDENHRERDEILVKLISQCMEQQNKEPERISMLTEDKYGIRAVNTIEVKGNTEGFSIMTMSAGEAAASENKESIREVNDIVCQALGMVMERYGSKVHYHTSTLRRMIARSLFEEDSKDRLRVKDMQNMYDKRVLAPFVTAILESRSHSAFQMNKAGNCLADACPNSFIYMKEHRMYVLFSDICREEGEKKVRHSLEDLCEKYDFVCGVSEPFEDIDLIGNKKFMVLKALEIGSGSEPEKRLYMEYDYYIQTVCSCAAPYIGHARYQEAKLQKLKQEDEIKGTEFYNTLKEYLLHGNNVSMTSKKLFIHRNTMIYRLSKINEILGVDINDPTVSQRLMLSIILQEQETCV